MALMVILGATFTSCKEDTQPRLEVPTEFVLNTPPMANETYVLEEYDGDATQIYLTVSQPNYGLGTVTNYEVQLSKTEDFAVYQSLITVNTQAKIQCDGYEWSVAMNALNGITTEEDFDKFTGEAEEICVRVRAYVANADEYSSICSNVIKLNVQPYFAVRAPGKIYVIGNVNGWDINNGAIYLSEPDNGIGSHIYSGEFEITAEQASSGFRFYTELGSWGNDGALPSIGANANDGDNASISLDDDSNYTGPCVYGKGNWNITNWTGGKMKMTVDLNEMKVYFQKAN